MKRFTDVRSRIGATAYECTFALLLVFSGAQGLLNSHVVTVTMHHAIPLWLALIWVASFLIGGVLTLVGVLFDSVRTELAGQIAVAYGVMFFTIAFLALASNPLLGIVYLCIALSASTRAWTLRGAVLAAAKAARIRRRQGE